MQTIKIFKVYLLSNLISHSISTAPKQYKYVRKILHLPYQASIRSRAATINYEPGFLTDVIEHLQTTLDEDDKDSILLVHEISIKKEVV